MDKKTFVFRFVLALLFAQAARSAAVAQPDYALRYTIGLDTAAHYLNVRLDYVPTAADSRELVLNMPVWTPGYYEILNFPKHLCDFAATDGNGLPLTWRKEGMNHWPGLGQLSRLCQPARRGLQPC